MLDNNLRIARNSLYMSIRMLVVLLVSLYSTRLLLSILGIVDYGIYNVVCGFVSMFSFVNTSISVGYQRFYSAAIAKDSKLSVTNVYNISLIIQILISIILCVLIELVGVWYIKNVMVFPPDRLNAVLIVFQTSVISLMFVVLQAPYTAIIMAYEKMNYYSLISVVDILLKLIAILTLHDLLVDKLIFYGLFMLIISFLSFLAYYLFAKRSFAELKFIKYWDLKDLRTIVSFSGWNMLGMFAHMFREQGVNLILNIFFGPVVNAARSVSSQVNSALQTLVQNINIPVRPQVIKSYAEGNIDRTIRLTYSVSKLSSILLYIFSYPILLELNTILKLWLGDNIPAYTNYFIILVVLTSYLSCLNSIVSGVVQATGKMMKYQLVSSIIILSIVPLSYLLLKQVALAIIPPLLVLISMVILQIASLIILKSLVEFKIKDYLKETLLPLIVIILTTFWGPLFIHCVMPDSVIRLILVVGINISLVCISSYLFALSLSEKNVIRQLFNTFSKYNSVKN